LGHAQVASNDLKGAFSIYQKAVGLYPDLLRSHESLLKVLKGLAIKDQIAKEETAINQLRSKQ